MTANQSLPQICSLASKRVWVAGHRGMVGSALVRRLERESCTLLTVGRDELDLRRQAEVEAWMLANRPNIIFMAAATVGGILANSVRPAEFLYDNLTIESNIIHSAAKSNIEKLMFLGAACLYPRLAPQPMKEDSLLNGPPEPTNEAYTVAKIAGVKLCQAYRKQYGCDFIVAVPANLYGPDDRFDAEAGHVVPGLICRAHAARINGAPELPIWGAGNVVREFMHVDDCADALVFLMQKYSDDRMINIGTGEEIAIGELAREVCRVVGYSGRVVFDTSKPDGMPRKLLDASRILEMGWRSQISLRDGLHQAYAWFLDRYQLGKIVA
jgi:GDP-L-fucose synthase